MKPKKPSLPTAQELIESVLERPLTEDDALLWMVLLHTHRIHLRGGGSANGETAPVLYPETQRGAAEIIANLWPERTDARANYAYWYGQYNTRTPYEVLSAVPAEMLSSLRKIRDLLGREPRIQAVTEDD